MTAQDPATIPPMVDEVGELVSCTVGGGQWTAWATTVAEAAGPRATLLSDGSFKVFAQAQDTANPPYVG